jgi:hypothetical protein
MKRFSQFVYEADVASVNIGSTNITADKKANTVNMSTKIGDNTTVTANKDMGPGGAASVSANMNIDNKTSVTASQSTPAYNKGQIGGVSSVGVTHKDDAGDKHDLTTDKGIGFGGAGKDVQQGRNRVTTYRKNDVNVATKVGY